MKKEFITVILTAGKGKVIHRISTDEKLGKRVTVHPQVEPLSDFDEVPIEAGPSGAMFDFTAETEPDVAYVQTLLDNLNSGDSILFSAEGALFVKSELILKEGASWVENSIVMS